jgi:hypothetical protein
VIRIVARLRERYVDRGRASIRTLIARHQRFWVDAKMILVCGYVVEVGGKFQSRVGLVGPVIGSSLICMEMSGGGYAPHVRGHHLGKLAFTIRPS